MVRRHLASARHVAVLVAIPVLAIGVPALAGHLVVFGDGLNQFYPLRILVGLDLRHGQLPLWDPYLWSGTPLLAGFNAGAAYPATWLFALIGSWGAWSVNEILVYALGAVGMWTLLRQSSLGRGASLLGSVTYAYAGFMSAHLVHLDVVEGASLAPWVLAGLRGAAADRRHNHWGWALLTGVAYGLVILTGSPEAILDVGAVALVYAGGLLVCFPQHRLRLLASSVGALALALAISGAQWVPGLAWIAQSQRSQGTYAFFVSGSLYPQALLLAFVPYALGAYGNLLPSFMGRYNLVEVTSYVGLLPLVAAIHLLSRWSLRADQPREWRAWYAVLAVSLLLALGRYVPVLPHLLFHVPLYGSQRLPSRNIVGVDLALAAIFAIWVEHLARRARVASGAPSGDLAEVLGPEAPVRRRWAVVAATTPAVVTVGTAAALAADRSAVLHALGVPLPVPARSYEEVVYIVLASLLAIGAAPVALLAWRRPARRRLLAVAGFVALDLAFFSLYQYWTTPPPRNVVDAEAAPGSALAALARQGGKGARFAVYDPRLYDYTGLLALGQPDLNILRSLPSVQGYSSLIGQSYEQATHSHEQASIDPAVLAGPEAGRLRLRALATLPAYFLQPVPGTKTPGPVALTASARGDPPAKLSAAQAGAALLGGGATSEWYFGTSLGVRAIRVRLAAGSEPPLQAGLLTGSGAPSWAGSPAGGSTRTLRLAKAKSAYGVALRNTSGSPLAVRQVVVTTRQGTFALAGELHAALAPPQWSFAGTAAGWGLFVNREVRPAAWADPAGAPGKRGATKPGRLVVKALAGGRDGSQSFLVVSSEPVTLVRSESYASGWRARIGEPGARSVTVRPVLRHGVLQAVRVGAGTHLVTFVYQPGSVTYGLAVSALGALATIAWALLAYAGWRRRRRHPSLQEVR